MVLYVLLPCPRELLLTRAFLFPCGMVLDWLWTFINRLECKGRGRRLWHIHHFGKNVLWRVPNWPSTVRTDMLHSGDDLGRLIPAHNDMKHPSHLLLPVIPSAPASVSVRSPLCNAVPGAARFTQ